MKNLPIYCIIVIGNPLTYLGHNLVWDRVSLLKQYDSLTFDYNASGIRTRKGTTTYELDGTNILSETGSGYTLTYLYGLGGLIGFKFGDNNYYYEKNLQGDITGIYDAQGTLVGSYSYDAWGKCSITYDTAYGLAFLNPFRYRGYYYDRETGLYYLNSRYYDPNTGRFINADVPELLFEEYETFTQYNLFAYCWNNPINMYDPNGYDATAISAGILSGLLGFGSANFWNVFGWVALGAVVVTGAVIIGTTIYDYATAASKNKDPDPYARPGQKNKVVNEKTRRVKKRTGNQDPNLRNPKSTPQVTITESISEEGKDDMHIWTIQNWQKTLSEDVPRRTGLRFRYDNSIDPEVKAAFMKFANWVRSEYYFPLRVTVYVKEKERLKAKDGEMVVGIFFEPFSCLDEPHIRVAVGDYLQLKKSRGKNKAIIALLATLIHEITHYYQWINNLRLTPQGSERQASNYVNFILDEYNSNCNAEEKLFPQEKTDI